MLDCQPHLEAAKSSPYLRRCEDQFASPPEHAKDLRDTFHDVFSRAFRNDEPSVIELSLAEDSTSSDPKLAPRCDKALPPDAILSSHLSMDELKALFAK